MIKTRAFAAGAIACALLIGAACKKDHLTVESTAAPPSTHTCQRNVVDLDVDSLTHCISNPPGEPKLTLTICKCDTLVLNPVNIPGDYFFEHWIIDQDGEDEDHNQLVLDTITVNSELWLEFLHNWQNVHVRIKVNVGPC